MKYGERVVAGAGAYGGPGAGAGTAGAALLERERVRERARHYWRRTRGGTTGGRLYWKGSKLALRKGRKLTRLIGVRACGRMHAVTACGVVIRCGIVVRCSVVAWCGVVT